VVNVFVFEPMRTWSSRVTGVAPLSCVVPSANSKLPSGLSSSTATPGARISSRNPVTVSVSACGSTITAGDAEGEAESSPFPEAHAVRDSATIVARPTRRRNWERIYTSIG
jgi:hypothetical protein